MLVAAAFCPHPPLVVPEVAGAAAPELDGVRAACGIAVRRLLDARPQLIVVVGGGPVTAAYDATAGGSLGGYGSGVRVGPGRAVLPLSLTVGRWLLEDSLGPLLGPEVLFHSIDARAAAPRCLSLGAALGMRMRWVGMLVMGDGSACHAADAPGYIDRRAYDFDAEVAKALASGDANTLGRLDHDLAEELLVAGRAAWQVLAGAADGSQFQAELLVNTTPYGVGYLVASWSLA